MEPEDIEESAGVPEAAPAVEDSSYSEILEGQAEAPIKPEAGVKTEEKTNLEEGKSVPEDQEIILEIGGKEYTVKQSEAVQLLENQAKFAEREKALSEKEKSLNRDYTQKSQQVAEFRKSFEGAFGRLPERNEIQALGKVWKSYFSNPKAKEAINAIIEGRFDVLEKGGSAAEPGKQADPYVAQLESKIFELENRLGEFTDSMSEREESQRMEKAQQSWKSWEAKKAEAGVKITEEIDKQMTPFIFALKQAHPDWEDHKILDEAYDHATLKDIKKTVASEVLKSVDKAKNGTIPRIKPKSTGKSDSEKTYADIFLGK